MHELNLELNVCEYDRQALCDLVGPCRVVWAAGGPRMKLLAGQDATTVERVVYDAVAAGRLRPRQDSDDADIRRVEDELIRVEQDRAAAERLGLTARASEYAAQIETMRGKLAKIGNVSGVSGTLEARPSSATPESV